jgi:hypothetical protein
MEAWIHANFKDSQITNDQLRCIFRPAQVPAQSQDQPKYDYVRLLEVYRTRHSGMQV